MSFEHEPHEPIADCDCHHCAVAERNRLRHLLAEAADDIESWGAYASEYFQQKHDLAGCVAKYRNALTPNVELSGAEPQARAPKSEAFWRPLD